MYLNSRRVTLDNISEVLTGYSLDIQDEVRSMILDGLDLSEWVSVCRENPYRLNQIRLAVKEGVPKEVLNISSGHILFKVRKYLKEGFSAEELYPYIGKGFDESQWDYILSWARGGYLDKRLNLLRTPISMWGYLDKGLKRNLPMWLFTTGKVYSELEIESMITIMSNGNSISKFLKGAWSSHVLDLLAEISATSWYGSIVDYVYDFISYDFLVSIRDLARKRVIDLDLFETDKDASGASLYVYQSHHIKAMAEAVSKGYDYTRLKNPHLSGTEVDIILSELERESNRNFKGRL